MRRRAGELLAIELAILACGLELAAGDEPSFYGFAIAKQLRDGGQARQLTAHGTLYKALARLEGAGLLDSFWEEPEKAEAQSRPRRRLYRITPSGTEAVQRSTARAPRTAAPGRPAPQPQARPVQTVLQLKPQTAPRPAPALRPGFGMASA